MSSDPDAAPRSWRWRLAQRLSGYGRKPVESRIYEKFLTWSKRVGVAFSRKEQGMVAAVL